MGKGDGWEHLGELSRLLQVFRYMYVDGDTENDSIAVVEWRSDVRRFFTVSG